MSQIAIPGLRPRTGPARPQQPTRTPSLTAALAMADAAFAGPPPPHQGHHAEARRAMTAAPLVRFVLPLDLCQPTNRTRHAPGWSLGQTKARLREYMAGQWAIARRLIERDAGRPVRMPFDGRPIVCAVRFTAKPTDAYADWAKAAIDVLTMPTARAPNRLGLILDDSPDCADVRQWCEPAPRGQGFVLAEVWA